MASDEENCIRVVAATLSQVSMRLQGDTIPADSGDHVSTAEAAEYVEMLDSLVANATSEERARLLLFDTNGSLMPTVVSLLRTPYTAVQTGDLSRLLIGALRCLSRTCTFPAADGAPQSYLSRLSCSTLIDNGGVDALVALLAEPGHAPEVHFSSGELLFAVLVRSDAARRAAVERDLTDNLTRALAEAPAPQARAYVAASLRELANSDATAVLRAPNGVITLVRSLGQDDAADVRALCAESIDVLLKSDPSAWRTFPDIKPLCAVLTTRLERESSTEVLEAVLKLLETILVCDAAVVDGNATFTEYFIAAFGDRLLVASMAASRRVASLAARTLRLLLQLAPHYRYVGFGLCQHFPSLSTMMRAMVQLDAEPAAPADSGDAVASQVLGVELGMAFSIILLQDPRSRSIVKGQLASTPQWMAQLRNAVISNLNKAALEYFVGIGIVDITGCLINDPRTVRWEPSGTRPVRSTIEALLPEQETRWSASNDLAPQPAAIGDVDSTQASRLLFVLLGYVMHSTLTEGAGGAHPAAATLSPQRNMGARADDDSSRVVPDGHRSQYKSPSRRIGSRDVGYTRSAMLREQRTHPLQSAAVHRVDTDLPDALPRASSYYTKQPGSTSPSRAQLQSAFVDPADARTAAPPPQAAAVQNPVFDKFDSALRLATRFAQFYNAVGDPQSVIYETDGSFARRQPKSASWYASPTPRARSWTVGQLKEGDLFYFALPFVGINTSALEQIRQRAVRHLRYVKNSFTITPQAAKARRWFLFDMLNNVMPSIIDTLSQLIALCQTHGDENVKFPIVMFRESEVAASDGTLNSGNLVEIVDQVRFYFKSTAAHNVDAPGAGPGAPGQPLASQYLRDVESKIRALSNAQFTGKEGTFLNFDDDITDEDEDEYVRQPMPAREVAAAAARRRHAFSDSDDEL